MGSDEMNPMRFIQCMTNLPKNHSKVLLALYMYNTTGKNFMKAGLAKKSQVPQSEIYSIIDDLSKKTYVYIEDKHICLNESFLINKINLTMEFFIDYQKDFANMRIVAINEQKNLVNMRIAAIDEQINEKKEELVLLEKERSEAIE